MIENRWWDRDPQRLEYEYQALRDMGVEFSRVEEAFKAGVLCLRLRLPQDAQAHELVVTFPDLYPYFRFEIAAPSVALRYHQHPASKNLCLMGRPTLNWNTKYTVAGLLSTHVPLVFQTATTEDRAAVIGKEQAQAEPYGDYYLYAASMILVQGNWLIPKEHNSGSLLVGLPKEGTKPSSPLIHSALLEVRGNTGGTLLRIDPSIRSMYSGRMFSARWIRLDTPLAEFDPQKYFDRIRQLDPGQKNNHEIEFGGYKLQLWGVVFPEEKGHREQGEGWLFVCRCSKREQRALPKNQLAPRKNAGLVQHSYFARAGRAGPDDLRLRTPELQPLSDKTVALFGLGCIGAPTAIELARSGLGHLKVVDNDIVDPGTIRRWPIGLSAAGRKKVEIIQSFINGNYPGTRVTLFDSRVGTCRSGARQEQPEEKLLEAIVSGTSLICDTTAERGVQYFLSQLAKNRGIAFVSSAGTYGGWGGKIIRIIPGRTKGCWFCAQCAFDEGLFTEPPADPERTVQPLGCGDPTFTGSGFDLAQVALTGVRTIVATLAAGATGGYPDSDWDVMTIAFRDEEGNAITPLFKTYTGETSAL